MRFVVDKKMKINQLPHEILWMIANRTVDRLDESAPNPFKIEKPSKS